MKPRCIGEHQMDEGCIRCLESKTRSQSGQALLEYLLVLSVFVIIFRIIFVRFQGLIYEWWQRFLLSVGGPGV